MGSQAKVQKLRGTLTFELVQPGRAVPTLAEDVRGGLLSPPRVLPPKYFYDDLGSRLFDEICNTPEYYLTRTEEAILQDFAEEIVAQSCPEQIIELGSGTSRKTRHLLEACERQARYCTYWPFDICESTLQGAAEKLMIDYPWLGVNALVGDYLAGFHHLPVPPGRRLFLFLGSTIGNFEHQTAVTFLSELRNQMQGEDRLLLGVDRDKSTAVLNAAYNDAGGVTAQFNLNVLRVLNHKVDADFDLAGFEHLAYYNRDCQQIEMYLVAVRPQRVLIGALSETLDLRAGERILTEISRKYTMEGAEALLEESGFRLQAHYRPRNHCFSLLLARPV